MMELFYIAQNNSTFRTTSLQHPHYTTPTLHNTRTTQHPHYTTPALHTTHTTQHPHYTTPALHNTRTTQLLFLEKHKTCQYSYCVIIIEAASSSFEFRKELASDVTVLFKTHANFLLFASVIQRLLCSFC